MPLPNCLSGLRMARLRSGIEVEKLAARIGVTVNAYYRYESGSRRMYVDKAFYLAKMLGCTVDDLLSEPAAAPQHTPEPDTVVAAALEGWNTDAIHEEPVSHD